MRINHLTRGQSGEGVWTLTGKEPFFAGHFHGAPLVPGVLIAEALAQFSGLVGPSDVPTGKLVHVDVRFDRPVAPPADIALQQAGFEPSGSWNNSKCRRCIITKSSPAG